jgi:hypothetical protein
VNLERFRSRGRLIAAGCVLLALVLVAIVVYMAGRDADGPPADAATAREINKVVATLFLEGPSLEDKLALVDLPTGLDKVFRQGMEDDRAPRLTVAVPKIELGDGTATAHITFFIDGRTALRDGRLELTHSRGRWVAQRDSYCALIEAGGLQCPTPAT